MNASRLVDVSEGRQDGGLAAFAHDTWNTPAWIARHREMTPGQRIELAAAISRAALQFAHARRVAPDDG